MPKYKIYRTLYYYIGTTEDTEIFERDYDYSILPDDEPVDDFLEFEYFKDKEKNEDDIPSD